MSDWQLVGRVGYANNNVGYPNGVGKVNQMENVGGRGNRNGWNSNMRGLGDRNVWNGNKRWFSNGNALNGDFSWVANANSNNRKFPGNGNVLEEDSESFGSGMWWTVLLAVGFIAAASITT